MSELSQALQAELDARTPGPPPSFDSLLARRRRRDRRRAAAAVSLTVAAVAVVGGSLAGRSSGRPPVAAGDPAYATYVVRFDDDAAYRRDRSAVTACLDDPSVLSTTPLRGTPPRLSGLLQGEGAGRRLQDCLVHSSSAGTGMEAASADSQPTGLAAPYSISADGRRLLLEAAVGGGCETAGLAGASATESPDRVLVHAVVVRPPTDPSEPLVGCPAVLPRQPVTVRLDAPLGDREVVDAATGRRVSGPAPGDPATWDVDPARPPRAGATSFSALVTRVACAGGQTGEVLAPTVVETVESVTVTFTAAALGAGFHTCPGNDAVAAEVPLREPLGTRTLVDGGCASVPPAPVSLCQPARRGTTTGR